MQNSFELPRSESTFAKDSTISKRKKIALIAVAAVLIVASIIGLAVGVSMNKKDHKDKTAAPAPSPTSTENPVTPRATFKEPSASAAAFERQVYAANKTTPDVLESFLLAVSDHADKFPIVFDKFPDVSKLNISSQNLLMYIRDFNIQSVIDAVITYADTKDISPIISSGSDLPDLLNEIKAMLKPEAIKKWGKLLADGHIEKANSSETAFSPSDLVKAAKAKGISLPTPTVSVAALKEAIKSAQNNTDIEPQAQAKPSGRRLLQDSFQPTCLPVVFHVLQYESVGGYFPGATEAGTGEHLVERLNYAFSNGEYHTFFDHKNNVPTGVTFRLGAVVDDPVTNPHLLVADGDLWGACNDQDQMMQTIAAAINAQYSPTEYINVIVCGQPGEGGSGVLGYAWVPGPDSYPEDWQGSHIFLRTDEYLLGMNNNDQAYNRGGWTLAHEVGHHLGLHHPHSQEAGSCTDGDGLSDTATTLVVQSTDYFPSLVDLCSYWRAHGTWYSEPWKGWTLDQMSSCTPAGDIDPVFNVMEYTAAACSSHFTPQQVSVLQQALPYFRPALYKSGTADGQCAAARR